MTGECDNTGDVVQIVNETCMGREAFEMDIVTRPDDATLEDYEQVTRCYDTWQQR